ncbi:DUF171-domain-containing protein [Xylona heveae TC161]|uniref:DUF171-domain-containing protein n=1 Tax=Xylona heveae (strain CBS 132557 / TC161) TaxID=1328760 RepID=A0A161TQR6_XYLHT|nr:DUF171-domain-containing protein [Xylona heveae TC161]KZF24716.1 DUF171-domain-containing protein [Xylona heveae TC161]
MGPNNTKKRKRDSAAPSAQTSSADAVDTSKPTAVFQPSKGRPWTVSVALPGSIIANAQTPELKTILAGQVARALAVFCVDEVVIFDDGYQATHTEKHNKWRQGRRPQADNYSDNYEENNGEKHVYTGYSDPNHYLTQLLSYLETPPHLRKHLFPFHPNLSTAGILPSLDMPHHLRPYEWCQYREGVTVEDSYSYSHKPNSKKTTAETVIESGLRNRVTIPASIPPNTRVTLKFPDSISAVPESQDMPITAEVVSPDAPREEAGYYWGYALRPASSLSAVFTECGYDGGYDVTLGTSERGRPFSELTRPSVSGQEDDGAGAGAGAVPTDFRHLLIVFGGVAGLEVAVKADKELSGMGVTQPEELFDYWVNLCPGQGSRTIRTEEAVWIGLMGLRDIVLRNTL